MIDLSRDARYRRTAPDELVRITRPLHVNGVEIATGTWVSMASLADTPNAFLDGNVYASSINLAPSRLQPYTGTRWLTRLHSDGTWTFLNQGQEEQVLAGSAGIVTLGRPPSVGGFDRFNATRWLMYRDLTGFRLRPCMQGSGWLGVRDSRAVLSGPRDPADRWIYWAITPYGAGE